MYPNLGRDAYAHNASNDPRRISQSGPTTECLAQPLARPTSTTNASPDHNQQPEEYAHQRGYLWVARFGVSWTCSTTPEGEVDLDDQAHEERTTGPGDPWTARFGVGRAAHATPEAELAGRNEASEEDTIGPGNRWTARFGIDRAAHAMPEAELNIKDKLSKDKATRAANQWAARFDISWTTFAAPSGLIGADYQSPEGDAPRRRCQLKARRGSDETSMQGESSQGDLSEREDQSPAADDITLMAREIEQSRRRLEEMAGQEYVAEQLHDVAAHVVNTAGTIVGLLEAERRLSRHLAARVSVAEAERDMVREAAAVESRERQQLNSQLSKIRQQVSARQREADAFKHSAGEERDELWERVKESDAANRRLQTKLSRATSENEVLKNEVEDMRGELDEIQKRNHELQVDLASCEGSRQTMCTSWIRQNIEWGEDIMQRKRKSEQQGTMNKEALEVFKRAEDALQRVRNLEQQGAMKKEVLEGPEEEHSNRHR